MTKKPLPMPYQLWFDKDYNLDIPQLTKAEQDATLALQRETNIASKPLATFSNAGQFTIDPAMAWIFNVTLTGDSSLLVTNGVLLNPVTMVLRLTQDAAGGRQMFWPVNVRWGLNTPPVLNMAPNAVCLVSLDYDPDTEVWDGSVQSGELVTSSNGGGGSAKTFPFVQNAPSTTWVINHMLGKHPTVVVMDSSGNEVEGEIKYNGLNQVVITFSSPFSGEASLM